MSSFDKSIQEEQEEESGQRSNAATGDFGCLPTFSRACFEAGLVIKG